MAQAMILRRGGVGVDLPFVVAATYGAFPVSPDPYTIGVVSSVAAGSLTISNTQPTSPATGDLWCTLSTIAAPTDIPISEEPPVSFSAQDMRQYDGSAWVNRATYTFVEGVWTPWRTYLYLEGDEYGGNYGLWSSGYGSISKGANYITINSTGSGVVSAAKGPIPLADYNKLFLRVEAANSGNGYLRYGFDTNKSATSPNLATTTSGNWTSGLERTFELSLVNQTANAYLLVQAATTISLRLLECYLLR